MIERSINKTEQRKIQKLEKETRQKEREKKLLVRKILVTGIILAIIGGFIGLALWENAKAKGQPKGSFADPAKGKEGAGVVVREFSDFQCPACRLAEPIVKEIMKKYEDRVQFIIEDYPLPQHENAKPAARYAECVREQGKFFEYQEKLFSEQDAWKDLSDPKDVFLSYAKEIGADENGLNSCLSSDRPGASIEEDIEQGNVLGVKGTPTFFINNKRIGNPRTVEQFSQDIEEALVQ